MQMVTFQNNWALLATVLSALLLSACSGSSESIGTDTVTEVASGTAMCDSPMTELSSVLLELM
jgi:hypothetical protein